MTMIMTGDTWDRLAGQGKGQNMGKTQTIEPEIERVKARTPEHETWEVWVLWGGSWQPTEGYSSAEEATDAAKALEDASVILHVHIPAMEY